MIQQKQKSLPAKMEDAVSSPTMKGGTGLMDRLSQDFREVSDLFKTNDTLRRRLCDSQTNAEKLENLNASMRNAKAMQQARIDVLEQENQKLKEQSMEAAKGRRVEATQQESGIRRCERESERLNVENNGLKVKITESAAECSSLRVAEEMTKTADGNKALSEENRRLAAQNTLFENERLDLQKSREELDVAKRKITRLESREQSMLKELDEAARLQDVYEASKRRISELENALIGLRKLLSSQTETHDRALGAVKSQLDKGNAERRDDRQTRDAYIATDRLQHVAHHVEQSEALAHLAASHYLLAREHAGLQSRDTTISHNNEQLQRLFLDAQQEVATSTQEVARLAELLATEKDLNRRQECFLNSANAARNNLKRDLAQFKMSLETESSRLKSANGYCNELERQLRAAKDATAAPLKREAELEEALDQLRARQTALEVAKAGHDEQIRKLTKQAGMRELAVTKIKREKDASRTTCGQLIASKLPRKVYVGTKELEYTVEAQLRPLIYELYAKSEEIRSSPIKVTVGGRAMPHGFSKPAESHVELLDEQLGKLEDGMVDAEAVEVLLDVPWQLRRHAFPPQSAQMAALEPAPQALPWKDDREVNSQAPEVALAMRREKSQSAEPEEVAVTHSPAPEGASALARLALSTTSVRADDVEPVSQAEVTLPTPTSPISTSGTRASTPLTSFRSAPQRRELLPGRCTGDRDAQQQQPQRESRPTPRRSLDGRSDSTQPLPKRPRYEESDDPRAHAPKRPRASRQPSYEYPSANTGRYYRRSSYDAYRAPYT
ncbi:hypothetical protein LTR85_008041 [Meristemomyces frigidus]|nr:hypothetical protein LTR85_008041 [Meristemomyces frigidus]